MRACTGVWQVQNAGSMVQFVFVEFLLRHASQTVKQEEIVNLTTLIHTGTSGRAYT